MRWLLAALSALFLSFALAAAAQAAQLTVQEEGGAPQALAPGLTLRDPAPTIGITREGSEKAYSVTVTGPAGQEVMTPINCFTLASTARQIDAAGNGNYTVAVKTYADDACSQTTASGAVSFAIATRTAIAAPATTLITRKPGDFTTLQYPFQVELNTGAHAYEFRYAKDAVLGPDGGIAGVSKEGFVDASNGQVAVRFDEPGTYTLVARVMKGLQPVSPWSPAVTVKVVAPFDMSGRPVILDSRGPSYKIKGTVREPGVIGGRVKVSIARGSKGKLKSVGTAKVRAGGVFTKRFTLRRAGKYRLRVTFAGNDKVVGGWAQTTLRITRRVVFG